MLPAPSSSRTWLTFWATAAKLLLVVLVSGWLLLTLGWALLHGFIVPRIDQFRPQLETLATQATGVRVEIGELSAHSTGVFPSFELKQVRLFDADGRPALQLPQVLIALSPRSVLTLSLEQLVIRGADLDVRRTSDGRLFLAGIAVTAASPEDQHALTDWLLSQDEWALLDGTVRWTDEQQGVSVVLSQVDAVMRNPGQKHQLRIDATPPPQWGDRFSLQGAFKQPLLSRSGSHWRQWSGQLYGQFSRIDLSALQAYAPSAGLTVERGHGALRAWIDVADGRFTGATADVALDDVQVRMGAQQPLDFQRLAGRLGWTDQGARGLDFHTESLSFHAADGLHWPGGNLALNLSVNPEGQVQRGQVKADKLDLQSLATMAQRLPLAEDKRAWLKSVAPQGQLEQFELSWQGSPQQPSQLSARGKVSGLALAAASGEAARRPGLAGVAMDFRMEREGGEDRAQASFRLERGWLEFPGLFQEPRLALDQFSGELKVRRHARGTEVDLRQASLSNPDAEGQFQASWKLAPGGDPLGSLDLQGQLARADAARIWTYLPQQISLPVRQYMRQAIQQGQLSDVRFKLKGPLSAFPFEAPASGDFQVSARLRNASFTYAPASLLEAKSKPWPGLVQLDTDVLLSRASLQLSRAQARVAGLPGLALSRGEARIAHLGQQPEVLVNAEIKGPLAQELTLVNRSPLSDFTENALARTTATGNADVQLQLRLPLDDLSQSKVQGQVTLPGNDVQFVPESPMLTRLRGTVAFSETGFLTTNAQARMLGGEMRFEGGMRANRRADEPEVFFRGQGVASVEGLQQWRELQALAPLLKQASGSTGYSATLGFRQGHMELGVVSNLGGVALALPEPLGKSAAALLPLRLDKSVVRESLAPGRRLQDRLNLALGPGAGPTPAVAVSYLRDISGEQAQVLGGQIYVGPEREIAPVEREVRAQVQVARLDIDAWEQLLGASGVGAGEGAAGGSAGLSYLPTSYNLRAGQLKVQGHTWQDVVLGGQREAGLWRATLNASELSGYGEYRQPSGSTPGRLFARLSRLSLGQGTTGEVEAMLDSQPSSIPTLDIVVDELELRGRKLGRLEVEAINRQAGRDGNREWRLSKLNLGVPEAKLTATGSWSALPGSAPSARGAPVRRGTQLNFRLDMSDAGELLKRLGMDGAIRRGKGKLEGQVSWTGSPFALHYPSLGGQMSLDVESGQFLKAEPGVARLLGVLNLQALPRRLTLDFRDVFSDGFAFDWIRGDVSIQQGVASTRDLRMKGVNAAVLMEGSADIARETQDLRVVVVPEINAGTASLLAYAINPAVAVGTFLAQWLLKQPLSDAGTKEFHVSGSWKDPQIQRVARTPRTAEPRATEGRP